jgi:hypothetical protein
MKAALANQPIEDFPNVVPLEQVALTRNVKVDTPDSAPTEGGEESPGSAAPPAAPAPGAAKPPGAPITPPQR